MKKNKRIWIIAIILIIIGIPLSLIGFLKTDKRGIYLDQRGLHIIESKMNEEKNLDLETINEIDIKTANYNIIFEDSDKYDIEIKKGNEDNNVNWEVKDGILKIQEEDRFSLRIMSFDLSFIDSESSYIKIYMPKNEQIDKANINMKNENITVKDISFNTLFIENKYGKINLMNITANSADLKMNSGNFEAKKLTAQSTNIENKYGRINLEDIDSKALTIESSDGNLNFTRTTTTDLKIKNKYGRISGKNINTINSNIEATDGKIELEGDFLGDTQINSSYGRVELDLKKDKSYYNLYTYTKYGSIKIDDEKIKDQQTFQIQNENGKQLKVNAKDANILIHFNR